MSSRQKSVSIDEDQQREIIKYMKFTGIKTFSGGVFSLIHHGLKHHCSNGNNGGGVNKNQNLSPKEIPECFGMPGDGFCEECFFSLKCAREFAKNGKKSTTKNNFT